MIRTILRLPLKPGRGPGLVDSFERFGIFEESLAISGCHSVEMALSVDGSEAVVTAVWENTDAYRAWTEREGKGAHRNAFNEFLSSPIIASTTGGIYEIAYVSPRPG